MMKIKWFISLIIFFTTFPLWSETDRWFSIGYEMGWVFERFEEESDLIKGKTKAKGISLSGYRFDADRHMGLFLHASLISPTYGKYAGAPDTDYSEADMAIGTSLILGTGFRGPDYLGHFQPYGGAGLHILHFLYHDTLYFDTEKFDYFQRTRNFGIGIEAGCKAYLGENFFMGIGSIVAWDFFSSSTIKFDGKTETDRPENYHALLVEPFLSLAYIY